jgi:thiopeptide-type bacteriocin biosynthesis protein
VKATPPATFAPSGFFVLRTPALSFATLADGATTSDRLHRLLERADVREALFVASPDLDARLDVWRRAPRSEDGRRIEQTLLRYVARMAGRATPFGLFAGCSVGAIGSATRLVLGAEIRRHTRLDWDYVALLAESLARTPSLRRELRFRPNSSLHRVGDRVRYRGIRREEKGWAHRRCAMDAPEYLDVVLARATGGATPDELVRALREHDPLASEDEAAEYVGELIDQQVLVADLAPAITGAEPIHDFVTRLAPMPAGAPFAATLAAVRDELDRFDAAGPGVEPQRYRAIAGALSQLPAPIDLARLFQVDLARAAPGAALGPAILAELEAGVELLRRITPPPPNDPLANFRRTFCERFGDTPETREVPLAEALDDETGVGDGGPEEVVSAAPMLEGIEPTTSDESALRFGARDHHLLSRATELLQRGEQEWSLTDEDLERLAVEEPRPLPDAFATLARIEAQSAAAIDRGEFRLFLAGANGPSGARMLGRFCHADPALADAVARHLRAEEALRPDALFAEIIHLPEGRMGNILARPTQREHEIVYLGRSGLPEARQIALDDLRVSVRGGRVVLRSASRDREVVPRLTSAHNFGGQQGVYRFLCSLQAQGVAGMLAWSWGPLASAAFLPRVVRGRIVLARAQWRVSREESSRLQDALTKDGASAIVAWRAARRLPRWVCLADADHELPIDLDERAMVDVLLAQLRERDATLTELFPAPDRLCVEGPEGRHVHEIIVPFVRTGAGEAPRAARSRPGTSSAAPATSARPFQPGSEWLTVKLYAGALAVDDLVRETIGPLAMDLVAAGQARRWFFVRYADPHGHLRLRFAGDPQQLRREVLPRIEAAVAAHVAAGRVWKLQLDAYEREVERYGGTAAIELCEQLFHDDSAAIVDLLRDDRAGDGDRRFWLALLGMDRLLADLGLDLETKRRTLLRARDAFHREFRTSDAVQKQIGAKYRAHSSALATVLTPDAGADAAGDAPPDAWARERAILASRSARSAATCESLRRLAAESKLTLPLDEIAPALLHMHCNRLLRSAARRHELVLYDFLHRHYKGLVARAASERRGELREVATR